jgi:ketosteroid isomerase-like protein
MLLTRSPRLLLVAAAITVSAVALSPAVLRADPPADAKKAITQNYNAMNAAMQKKDAGGMVAYMTPDFLQIGPKGEQVRLTDFRSTLEQSLTAMKSIRATTNVSKVTLDGTGKKASASVRNVVKMVQTNPQTNKDSTLVGTEDAVDTWVKTPKGWRLQVSKSVKVTYTVDGKPAPM